MLATHEEATEQRTEQEEMVNAIRDGRIVQVYWNELTEEEQRAAYCNMFLTGSF